MKKFLLLALAGLALVGCKKDDVKKQNTKNDINFATQIGTTRAAETTTANLEAFKVYVEQPDAAGTGYETYFDAEVTKGTDGNWTYSPVQVWKGDKVLRFYGYAPKDLTYETTNRSIAFTPEVSAKDQKDFVVASLASSKAAKAVMPFKHALTQIIVKAKNTGDKYNVAVGSIRLTNYYNKGTLTMAEAATPAPVAPFTWNGTDNMTQKYFASRATVVDVNANTTDAVSLDFGQGAFMVIPQDLSGANTWKADLKETENNKKARLSFLIRVTSADGKTLYFPAKADKLGWAGCAINTNFEAGKKYVITLDFAKGAGYTDPDNGTDPVSPDPTPDPTPDPNTPVVNSNDIIFDVSVDEWEEGTEIEVGL